MPVVQSGGEAIFYAERQRRAAHHLVLIHGAGGEHTEWGYQLANLPHASVYAVDLPGHGRSAGDGRSSISAYVDDVRNFLDTVGLERAVVGGVSMGGAVAQVLALNHPERVAGLVLLGTGARLRVVPALIETLRIDFPEGVRMLVEWAYSGQAPPEVVERGKRRWLASRPEVMVGDFEACDAFDVRERLGQIGCPALVVCGTEDRLTPARYASFLRDAIPNAELSLVEGAGHLAMIEQPDVANRVIEGFLRNLEHP